jgi:hypothetical protein
MAPPHTIEDLGPTGPTLPDVLDVLWKAKISEPGRDARTFRFSVLERHEWGEPEVRAAIERIANGVENSRSLIDALRSKELPHPPSDPRCDAITLYGQPD